MGLKIVDFPKRNEVKLDKQKGIYNNGMDNLYPQRVERIISASVTAKTSTKMLKKFIIGGGFVDEKLNNIVVSSDILGEKTLHKLLSEIAESVSKHNGAYLAVQYNGLYQVSAVNALPYRDCRLGKADSGGYSGKIHVYSNWDGTQGQIKANDISIVDVFNTNTVASQFEQKHYKGQIAFLRLDDEFVYPLSPIDAALEDADTENQISNFKNTELRRGFFAKYIIHHTAFEGQSDADEFNAIMQKFIGGKHESGVLTSPATFNENGEFVESLNFKLEKIDQNINDKMFAEYERSCKANIRSACFAIPEVLLNTGNDNAGVFGDSGAMFTEAFNFYNSQVNDIRTAISQWLTLIFKNSADTYLQNANFTIKPLNYGTVDAGAATSN